MCTQCTYTVDSDIQDAPQECYYFNNANDGREFAIRYAEFSPHDSARAYPYFTSRVVKASAGECVQYNIDEGASFNNESNDGEQDVRVLHYFNSTFNGTIAVPTCDAALDSTTYIYNELLPPQNATSQSCGTRCLWLYAWQNKGPKTQHPMLLFQCPISISEVSNTTPHSQYDWQSLPDLNARLAAASIALTGRYNKSQWVQGEKLATVPAVSVGVSIVLFILPILTPFSSADSFHSPVQFLLGNSKPSRRRCWR